MKIGITGANGQLGRLVLTNLLDKTQKGNIVALVRNPSKSSDLGVETRTFDYDKKNQENVLKDIDILLLISSSEVGKRYIQHKNVIETALNAGVKKIVYTSLLNADTSTLLLAEEHKQTENLIFNSKVNYTILRNNWYSENYTLSIKSALDNGSIIGSAGNGKISSATRNDYAEAASIVLTTTGHDNKIYELAGDEYYTLSDFAKEISKQTGKEVTYQNLEKISYKDLLINFGIPKGFAEILADSDFEASKDQLYSTKKDLSNILKRPTTPISESIKLAI